jgi:hypothetical protein
MALEVEGIVDGGMHAQKAFDVTSRPRLSVFGRLWVSVGAGQGRQSWRAGKFCARVVGETFAFHPA